MIEELSIPVTIGPEAYISDDYARAERDRLWRKVWLQAGRLEDITEVGNYITYDIGDDSVIIVRTGANEIKAYHNVCPHRGRRLIDTPPGQRNARGKKTNLICGFHGWTFNLQGQCTFIQHQDDWQGSLTEARTALGKVSVDSWGGWVWINLDPDCGPLRDFLGPIPDLLDPFGLQNQRPRWRKWIVFDCNWKVAMEAFAETYHVQTTHPEFNAFGEFRGWARVQGLHSNIGYEAPKNLEENQAKLRVGTGDARLSTAEMQDFTWENANTNTTMTLVNAARRLKDELPEGTPPADVSKHWLASARADDEARGLSSTPRTPHGAGRRGRFSPISRSATRSITCSVTPLDPMAAIRTSAFSKPPFTSFTRRAKRPTLNGNIRRAKTGRRCCNRISPTWRRCREG